MANQLEPMDAGDGVQAIDDDALDAATGGIVLCSTPSTCNVNGSGSGSGYTVNSTIYFQTNISSTIT